MRIAENMDKHTDSGVAFKVITFPAFDFDLPKSQALKRRNLGGNRMIS